MKRKNQWTTDYILGKKHTVSVGIENDLYADHDDQCCCGGDGKGLVVGQGHAITLCGVR